MKGPYTGLLTIACLLSTCFSFAQPICGFDALHGKAMNTDPVYKQTVLDNNMRIQTILQQRQARSSSARISATAAALYTIPVVVHVVHTGGVIGSIYNPSDADITGAVNYLNQVYDGTWPGTEGVGDIQIRFVLATLDPNCHATNGIHRLDGSAIPGYLANGINAETGSGATELNVKNASRWDPYRYYNVWVVHKIDGVDGTSGQFIAGFAAIAGSSPAYDGTVMLATQMKSGFKTLPHEMGHALGLYHPFEGSANATDCQAPEADCTLEGDLVCDTDPITYNQTGGVVNFTCRTGTNACTGTPYTIETEHNIMNYTSCFTLFTPGQKDRMLAAMWLRGRRKLSESGALSGAYPPVTYSPPAAACASNTSSTGLSGFFAGILNVSLANRSFNSLPARSDNGYVNETASCLNLVSLQASGTYNIYTTLLGANREQVNAWIDFNNNGSFETAERILRADSIMPVPGSYPVATNAFTIPSGAVQGTVLRMRVTEELSTWYGTGFTISSACYNPVYGQTEDYPVLISASNLPVTMEYFKGIKQGGSNRLLWKTYTEANTSTFDIERSYNGIDYNRIGTVKATGSTTSGTYSYNDNSFTGQVSYYRLKQTDNSGSHTYSNIVIIKSETTTESDVQLLNNPFRGYFDLGIVTPAPATCIVNVLDATGKLVYTQTAVVSNHTILTITPRAKNLSAGVYMVQVLLNGKTVTRKLIKE